MDYTKFFSLAVGSESQQPYAYQIRLATEPFQDRVIRVPTGGGKTAAAVLAWLYRLTKTDSVNTPRRLVYMLPMRSLVQQTSGEAKAWLANLGIAHETEICELLGGDSDLRAKQRHWIAHPERPFLMIGTIDLLLTAALNRGYAISRYRWPAAFGLLHHDALWVVDETQLMGNAVATVSQLTHFRSVFRTWRPVFTWWMSATQEREWLHTVDYKSAPDVLPDQLDLEELRKDLGKRYTAEKPLTKLKALTGSEVLIRRAPKKLTLVVHNTVRRAQELFQDLQNPEAPVATKKKKAQQIVTRPELLLIHSRFRLRERRTQFEKLIAADAALRGKAMSFSDHVWLDRVREHGLVVAATQVIEAGLDISAEVLLTEIAPWTSMVQRLGRLKREGLQVANAYWVDKKDPAPYAARPLLQLAPD